MAAIRPDRELGWIILSSSFLVFLLVSVVIACYPPYPGDLPLPVTLARPYVGRAVFRAILTFTRYTSLAGMGVGLYGVIAWPSNQNVRPF